MAERLLEESSLVETVVLRPGDLVDEERDANTTSVQVSCTGRVKSPALVGREDVAALAISAATFVTQNRTSDDSDNDNDNDNELDSDGDGDGDIELDKVRNNKDSGRRTAEAFHYTFGCRWVGETLDSYPPQGRQRDGHANPTIAFRRALRTIRSREREKQREKRIDNYDKKGLLSSSSSSSSADNNKVVRMAKKLDKRRQKRRRRPKPYGICVAVPTYLFLALFSKIVLVSVLQLVPGGKELVLPWMNRARNWMVLGLSSLLSRLLLMLPSIGLRKPTFINF
mmetsp:Transcript_22357/g.46988  ORF Transcript_22357/g.46988 Transcript_22357/m.46988 type:complete len:283 (-) Transcript_22357:584-1432(-)